MEFLEDYAVPMDGQRFLAPFIALPVSAEVARRGSFIRRDLRARGKMIGDFDILIAATALDAAIPLVTDNIRHFGRIDGLTVEPYR